MRKSLWIYGLIIAVVLTVLFLTGLTFSLFIEVLPPQPPEQDPPPEHYYEALRSKLGAAEPVTVADMFTFDFDEAYVEADPYGDEAYYLKKWNVDTAVPIFQWNTGAHYRIFFLKDRCIIYDFVYHTHYMNTLQKDITIYPDTKIRLTEDYFSDGTAYLQVAFSNSQREGMLEYTVNSGEICIDYVDYSDGAIEIPSQLRGFPVTQIGEFAFYQNPCTSVSLPDTLKILGDRAFYRCYNLKEITLPPEIQIQGHNPFFRCSSLEAIHVDPANPHYREIDGILYDATGTVLIAYPEGRADTVLSIPEGVTEIADDAFGYCSGLQTVVIPESVTVFPSYDLFVLYDQITLVVVPGSAGEAYANRFHIPATVSG